MAEPHESAMHWAGKHWLLLAGTAGGVLIFYLLFGSSGSNTGSGTTIGGLDPQTYAQLASIAAQQDQQQTAAALQQEQVQAQIDLANNQLALQKEQTDAAAQISYLNAEGSVASGLANSYANVITARSELPASTISSVATFNKGVIDAAAGTIASGLLAASGAIQAEGAAVGQTGQNAVALSANNNQAATQRQQSTNQMFGSLGMGVLGLAGNIFG